MDSTAPGAQNDYWSGDVALENACCLICWLMDRTISGAQRGETKD